MSRVEPSGRGVVRLAIRNSFKSKRWDTLQSVYDMIRSAQRCVEVHKRTGGE